MSLLKRFFGFIVVALLLNPVAAAEQTNPQVILSTSMGDMTAVLYPDKAPITVENFLKYVDDGYYDNSLFHRVIPYFMVQTGGFDAEFNSKEAGPSIKNESDNGLQNTPGTLAMARYSDPDSASAQFFINVDNNRHLNSKGKANGYTVFGEVISGFQVAEAISEVETGPHQQYQDVPVEPVILYSVKRVSQ